MKVGMNLLLWLTHLTEVHYPLLENLRKIGFDGVEVPLGEGDAAHYQAVGKELDNFGLERTTIFSLDAQTNSISPDPAIRQASVDRLKWAIDMNAALGSSTMGGPFHSAFKEFSGEPPTEDEAKWAAEVLYQAAEHAKAAGVTLAIEALNRFECYFVNTIQMSKAFVQRVNHPNLQLMYDTHHSNIEEKSPTAAIQHCADVLAHVHISESDRGTPGTGQVNWAENFKALKSINYDRWLVIEAFSTVIPDFAYAINVWRNFDPAEEISKNGHDFVRRMWAET